MDSPEQMNRYKELASKWLDGSITAAEQKEYADWYNSENELPLYIPKTFAKSESEQAERMLRNILSNKSKVTHFKTLWRAAAVLFVFGLGVIGWKIFKSDNSITISQSSHDIFPAEGGVTLVLGNGNSILLDTVSNGKLNFGKEENIIKQKNLLSYADNKNQKLIFNTISTSKGKTYVLELSDGSRIWLDAASSVRFPTAFPGKERVIEVTGQVYLDVIKNAKKPFKVIVGGQAVEVLGTEFNVNGYANAVKTTLVNGSIKIGNTILKPLEQAVNNEGVLSVQKKIDISDVTAWKNGEFKFSGTSLKEIMNELQRWYDIDVEYQNEIPEMQLVAKISRDIPISKILNLLELTGQVSFTVSKNKIKVMSMKK
jgi:transmembrane sensor